MSYILVTKLYHHLFGLVICMLLMILYAGSFTLLKKMVLVILKLRPNGLSLDWFSGSYYILDHRIY